MGILPGICLRSDSVGGPVSSTVLKTHGYGASLEGWDGMRKPVIVRKCKSHRVLVGVFSFLTITTITICVAWLGTPSALLLYIPILLITLPMMLYYFSWQLHFEEKYIRKRCLFREIKCYSYVELRKVVKRYYTSEHDECVHMHFADGKRFTFRMDDDHAAQAVKVLQKHKSFVTK